MLSVVIGQKPKVGPGESMFLIPERRQVSQITAPENNVMHSWAGRWDPGRPGLSERGARHRALRQQSCRAAPWVQR